MFVPYKLKLLKRYLLRRQEGERILLDSFAKMHGKPLNLGDPRAFSEKLMCRVLQIQRHCRPIYTQLADKYSVRDYVRAKAGEKYLIELLWHGTDATAIPFETLPEKCVVKTNHGSGSNIILRAPVDRPNVIEKVRYWLKENYYWRVREYQYFDIKPRIMVETFLKDEHHDGPLDYRFWCFNGQPEIIQIDNFAHDINPFYDVNWTKLALSYRPDFLDRDIPKPANFAEMLEVAAKLSADFDFVRVDLYNLAGRIYVGELTFTPVAGRIKFNSEDWDRQLGDKWQMRY